MHKYASTALLRALYRNYAAGRHVANASILNRLERLSSPLQQRIKMNGFRSPLQQRIIAAGSERLKALAGFADSKEYARSIGIDVPKVRLRGESPVDLQQWNKFVAASDRVKRRLQSSAQQSLLHSLSNIRDRLHAKMYMAERIQNKAEHTDAGYVSLDAKRDGQQILPSQLVKQKNYIYGAKNTEAIAQWNKGDPIFATPYPDIAIQYLLGNIVNKAPKKFLFRAPRQQLLGKHKPPIASQQWGQAYQPLRKHYRNMVRAGRSDQLSVEPWQAGPEWDRIGWLRDYQYVASKPGDIAPISVQNQPQFWLPVYRRNKLVALKPAQLSYTDLYQRDKRRLGKYREMLAYLYNSR